MVTIESLAMYLSSPLGTEYIHISSEKEPRLMGWSPYSPPTMDSQVSCRNFVVFSEGPAVSELLQFAPLGVVNTKPQIGFIKRLLLNIGSKPKRYPHPDDAKNWHPAMQHFPSKPFPLHHLLIKGICSFPGPVWSMLA